MPLQNLTSDKNISQIMISQSACPSLQWFSYILHFYHCQKSRNFLDLSHSLLPTSFSIFITQRYNHLRTCCDKHLSDLVFALTNPSPWIILFPFLFIFFMINPKSSFSSAETSPSGLYFSKIHSSSSLCQHFLLSSCLRIAYWLPVPCTIM